jgi:hypothetical protein
MSTILKRRELRNKSMSKYLKTARKQYKVIDPSLKRSRVLNHMKLKRYIRKVTT